MKEAGAGGQKSACSDIHSEMKQVRIVVYTAGVLVVLAVAWTLYLNHGLKDFEASLSQAPAAPTTQQETPQGTTATESDRQPETEVSDDVLESDEATTIEDVSPKMESEEDQDSIVIWTDSDTESSVDAETGTLEKPLTLIEEKPIATVVGACGENCEPSESGVDLQSLSKNEQLEFMRKGLIKRFGDIREVHLFIDYMKLGHNTQTFSEEEVLESVRAIATLFPNEANKRHLQELELRVASRRTTQR